MTKHWAEQFIGRPWVKYQHDCWAFTQSVYKSQFNCELPTIEIDAHNVRACVKAFEYHPEKNNWVSVIHPIEGDAVLMSPNQKSTHIGVWVNVDGGGVLHCVEGAGVIFTKKSHIHLIGYHIIQCYRHKGLLQC